jgi:cyclopropane-fatty-acyl-phospholipid synthase
MVYNMGALKDMDKERSVTNKVALSALDLVRRNSVARARKNISAHYDLGNDFFEQFLDPTMMYSSALFDGQKMPLATASLNKIETICQKLQLKASDHLIEIGTGWGGMALYAASNYGCRVTTTTLSQQQHDFTKDAIARANLQDRVTVIMQDYRELEGKYDKLVSIEMIEAVGHQYFSNYFRKCSDLLKPDGLMAIQAITISDQRYEQARKSVDFIQRYIFPGGCLPSIQVIANHVAEDTDMCILTVSDMAKDYAKTLAVWRESFTSKIEHIRSLGFSEQFIRMWMYYLCYCEGGFEERVIGATQIVMAKPDYRPA